MRRGALIHGVLLVAMLLFAYQTWTREEVEVPETGEIVLWDVPIDQVEAAIFESKGGVLRRVRVERRSDERGSYWWGLDRKARTVLEERPEEEIEPDGTTVVAREEAGQREFIVGEQWQAMLEELAEMRVLRDIGQVDDERRAMRFERWSWL